MSYKIRWYDKYNIGVYQDQGLYETIQEAQFAAASVCMKSGYDGCFDIIDKSGKVVAKGFNPY